VKVLAFYLPQFHRIPENDEWWGEGFTEWTAVKGGCALYEGHRQPKVPYDNNYYDLLDKKTMEWQAGLMKKYQVYGMCIHHYWFKDGRKILEKPGENLLKWKDIEMPFCFSWANESWARTWSNLSNSNTWADSIEPIQKNDSESGILLEQEYGNKADWEKHFYYLLPFFNDERYIRIDGKPVFIIYKPLQIGCLRVMVEYFNKLAALNGFDGIYFIGNSTDVGSMDAMIYLEPLYSLYENSAEIEKISGNNKALRSLDYNILWEKIISRNIKTGTKCYLCGFPGYDDTPRRGLNGLVIKNSSPQEFEEWFEKLVIKSLNLKNEYVFLNAWNEWGEGMYLEPDKEYGDAYLEAVSEVVTNCNQTSFMKNELCDTMKNDDFDILSTKNEIIMNLLDKWLTFKEQGISFDTYLIENGYQSIAIYGMGILGRHLLKEFEGGKIDVKYVIDKRSIKAMSELPVYSICDSWPVVDLIIVTPVVELTEIIKMVKAKIECPVIGIDELFYKIR